MTAAVHPLLNLRYRVPMGGGGYFVGRRPRDRRRGSGRNCGGCVFFVFLLF